MPQSSPNNLRPATSPAIVMKGVSVTFGDQKALDGISLAIARGSIAAIVGPNGSGKTTMVRAILGLQAISAGSIEVFDSPVNTKNSVISYVPQRLVVDRAFPLTVTEFLHLISPESSKHDLLGILKSVSLETKATAKLGTLSGGQLQRAFLAQAILQKPDLLVLDEPDANIDSSGENQIFKLMNQLKAGGTTIILISHDLNFVSKAVDQVTCLNRELLCAGSPEQALSEHNLHTLFPESAHFHHH